MGPPLETTPAAYVATHWLRLRRLVRTPVTWNRAFRATSHLESAGLGQD
jgi:hypothetical protein